MTTTVVASVEAELLSSRERRTTTAGGFALCHLGLFFLREILMLSPRSHKKAPCRWSASIVSLLSTFESSARAPRRNFDVDDNSFDFHGILPPHLRQRYLINAQINQYQIEFKPTARELSEFHQGPTKTSIGNFCVH